MKALVLGAGPAGLFAAHALVENGHDVRILSKKRQSYMRGAQYLHKPIPGLSPDELDPFTISYELLGDVDDYRRKVYGLRDVVASPTTLTGEHEAWDIRAAYDRAWWHYSDLVEPWDATSGTAFLYHAHDAAFREADLVISTIPAPLLKLDAREAFESETIYSTDRAMEEVIGTRDNVVVCSGLEGHPWYRTSRIHGFENTEYPGASPLLEKLSSEPRRAGVWRVEKPIALPPQTAELLPSTWRLEGRYGSWTKGVLSHEAYYNVLEATR